MISQEKTCKRLGCGKQYTDQSNEQVSCLYHAGWPIFRDVSKTWTCCQKSTSDWDDFMKIEGCARGSHSDIKPIRPVLTVQEDRSSAPVRVISTNPVIEESVEEIPVLEQAPQVEFVTAAGLRKCRHAGCMKEYDPSDNCDSACNYHEGVAGFRDTKKFWSCCNASSYDWDEFMKIPKCKTGPHAPKMVAKSQ